MNRQIKKQAAFTLIELVMVIVILGIVSVGISGFIGSSTQIFVDTTERDQLLSDSRFAVSRLNRELRNAVPSSIRISASTSAHCIEFTPIEWSTFYLDIPVESAESGDSAEVVALVDIDGQHYAISGDEYAIVYPTGTDDIYDATESRRFQISTCEDDGSNTSCTDVSGPANVTTLNFTDSSALFAADSPRNSMYIATEAISYCVRDDGNLYRHSDGFNVTQTNHTSGGILMGQNIVNTLSATIDSDSPFVLSNATLNLNALVRVLLRFERNDEIVEFNYETNVANVP